MITIARPEVRRPNSNTSKVPTKPNSTSSVVHCAPARNSSPSSS
jgi:hypothetical protein